MSKLARHNLQLFCRICLNALRPSAETVYNIHLIPNLTKLLIMCTSLDVTQDHDYYPKNLCQVCYNKLENFQSFRSTALQSSEVLRNFAEGKEACFQEKANSNGVDVCDTASERTNIEGENKLIAEDGEEDCIQSSIKTETTYLAGKEDKADINSAESGEVKVEKEVETFNNSERKTRKSIRILKKEQSVDGGETTSTLEPTLVICGTHTEIGRKRERNKKLLKCPCCDKQAYKRVYLDAHIRAVHEVHGKLFSCKQCFHKFTRYSQLQEHTQSAHQKSKKFVCDYKGCDAKFKLLTTLETHRKVVHKTESDSKSVAADPTRRVTRCVKSVTDSISSSVTSMISTTDPILAATDPLRLDEPIEMDEPNSKENSGNNNFCKICSKNYSSKRALKEHLKRHAKIKEHVCKVCGVAKVTRTELLTHMRTHEPNAEKFKCKLCPQEFNHKNAIQRHVRVVHEGLRPFPCSYCPKSFGTRNSKMCHERLHTGERPFTCEICSKGFAQSEGLKSHMKNHDKSLRTHVCRYCSQRFITRKNLSDHEKRHRSCKPHICNICSRGFFKNEDMLLHRKSHRENENASREAFTMIKKVKDEGTKRSTRVIRVRHITADSA